MQCKTDAELLEALTVAHAGDKWQLAKLISLFESSHPEDMRKREQVVAFLEQCDEGKLPFASREALILGVTGTPGAGKSSLIAAVTERLLSLNTQINIAVLAIDPSSQASGGSLLGDRTRMNSTQQRSRLFFRSQASALDLGGLGKNTFHVTRLLRRLFDILLIETVGIGQSEVDIQSICDHSYLVLQPLTGDQVQFMKAGIMEVPDTFIINKCDEENLAKRSHHLLKSSLVVSPSESGNTIEREIILTSAKEGVGISELAQHMLSLRNHQGDVFIKREEQETEQLAKSIRDEFGCFGENVLRQALAEGSVDARLRYEEKLRYIKPLIANELFSQFK